MRAERLVSRRAVRVGIGVALVVAAATAAHLATRALRSSPGPHVVHVRSGAEALDAWVERRVEGRVLFWYDRALPLAEVSEASVIAFLRDRAARPPEIEDSFVYLALRARMVQRVVYVVPDDRWEGFAAAARERPELRAFEQGFVQVVRDVPIMSVPARNRAAVTSGVPLVYVSGGTRQFFGDAFTDAVLAGAEGADLVVLRR